MSLLPEASCRTASQIQSKREWPASNNAWLVSGDAKRPRDGSRRRVRCLGLAHSQRDYEVTKASTRSFHHMRQRSQGANRRRELHRLASVSLFFGFRLALVQVRYCRTRARAMRDARGVSFVMPLPDVPTVEMLRLPGKVRRRT